MDRKCHIKDVAAYHNEIVRRLELLAEKPDQENIKWLSRRCLEAFERLNESLTTCPQELLAQIPLSTIEDDHTRFKTWCETSFHFPLFEMRRVAGCLRSLCDYLGLSHEIATGVREPWERMARDGQEIPPELREWQEAIHENLNGLIRKSEKAQS
ncbi:hypothetical protein BDW59DRAFT_165682 [Aspergillus cavernicola]|uniref:Uncharacterized protein n=1 Tax=Aspergillus cavernicola TaxID=176166 RepID=A0ABR4HRF1_9EURO